MRSPAFYFGASVECWDETAFSSYMPGAGAVSVPANSGFREVSMGIFDFLGKKSDQPPRTSLKEVARLERVLSNKLSQNFDRQEAIQELGRMGTAQAAAALLKRFDWVLDPSITDQEEKEQCMHGIVAAGEDALEPIREYCRKAESLTWPLKVLRAIVQDDGQAADELLSILDQFDTEYVRNPEPKVQLIQALEAYKSDDVRVAVEPFLTDMSEPVRFTAATTLFAIDNAASVPSLLDALANEESRRVQNRIAQGFADRGWEIPSELANAVAKALPPGFRVSSGKVQKLG
ncbi:MAG TPA: HEAT repeat domain-containing protein [Polyangiaceae bacterium]|nr:HEAT repeat domain-containing protein [Polyangiaceae bacterium]